MQQWDAPGSKGEVSRLLSGGLRRPAQDGYTWSLHRLRICCRRTHAFVFRLHSL